MVANSRRSNDFNLTDIILRATCHYNVSMRGDETSYWKPHQLPGCEIDQSERQPSSTRVCWKLVSVTLAGGN